MSKITVPERFDALLDPLSGAQKSAIRDAFRESNRPPEDATLLLADWLRIADTAHQHALKTEGQANAVLLRPDVRRRRDRQLRQAIAALDDAVESLGQATGLLEKHRFGMSYEALHQCNRLIGAQLLSLRHLAERYRLIASNWPRSGTRPGDTLRWIPERCLGEVLSAYFRHRKWPVSTVRTGLFSKVASLALSRRAMNDLTLRRLARSSADYAQLEAAAPRGVKPACPATAKRPQSSRANKARAD